MRVHRLGARGQPWRTPLSLDTRAPGSEPAGQYPAPGHGPPSAPAPEHGGQLYQKPCWCQRRG